jgi:hypothetical protein
MAKRQKCSLCGYHFYYGKCPNSRCVGFQTDTGKIKVIKGFKQRKET